MHDALARLETLAIEIFKKRREKESQSAAEPISLQRV